MVSTTLVSIPVSLEVMPTEEEGHLHGAQIQQEVEGEDSKHGVINLNNCTKINYVQYYHCITLEVVN